MRAIQLLYMKTTTWATFMPPYHPEKCHCLFKVHVTKCYNTCLCAGITADGHHQRSQSDTVDMMYSCNACPQLFDGHVELRAHIKSLHQVTVESLSPERGEGHHRSAVIITCPECKAEFYNMRSLNCHMRYHKRGKNYWMHRIEPLFVAWRQTAPNFMLR